VAVSAVGNLVEVSDFSLNSSDKLLVVPALTQWHLRAIWVKLVSSGDVGNRQVDVLLLDTRGNLCGKYAAGAVQVASRTQYFSFAPGHPQETGYTPNLTNGVMLRQLGSEIILTAGMAVRVYDSAAIAATADDLSLTLLVDERTV
jgi:hypothetical protein